MRSGNPLVIQMDSMAYDYLSFYVIGDSLKIFKSSDRIKVSAAVQQFFNAIMVSKYRTSASFFIGDTVMVCRNCPSENDPYWTKGIVIRESESGRLLVRIKWFLEDRYENHWFEPHFVEAYVP